MNTIKHEIKLFIIQGTLLSEPTRIAQCWDNNRTTDPDSWPLDANRAHAFKSFEESLRRLNKLYETNKKKLNKVTFNLIETTVVHLIDEDAYDPIKRMQELNKHFSPLEFDSKIDKPQ